jgi:protein involved in polysaccharide export with SLBB domain/GT2 family glycosyltransferase
MSETPVNPAIDCVIIGVNASATLEKCLASVLRSAYDGNVNVFYVDGGSVDDSVERARAVGDVQVIELDTEFPTPGLGRNQGWRKGTAPYVQFLDSDTVLDKHWFSTALQAMFATNAGAVRGRRKESHPENSVYNWIADLEWNASPGPCNMFGGDVLIRREALEATGGYDETLVAGEDPELSQRVQLKGYEIVQLDAPMTLHDLGMTTMAQYLKRAYRTGYGFAAVGMRAERLEGFWQTELKRILVRGGGAMTLAAVGCLGLLNPGFFAAWPLALLLLLRPRLLRVPYFQDSKGLNRRDAQRYAWHCSLVVVPEFFGMLRYAVGKLFGRPLRNRRRNLGTRRSVPPPMLLLLALVLLCGATSCRMADPDDQKKNPLWQTFTTEPRKINDRFATVEEVLAMSETVPEQYRLGAGDKLDVRVWNRDDISTRDIVVAPDGTIAVPRIGIVNVKGRTVDEVVDEVSQRLSEYYDSPEVTIQISEYANNKAFVLGRVANPGIVKFTGEGTLLEALALAGGLPVIEKEAFLTKCAIIRGKNQIFWIDLRELLNGNIALNAKIRNNDVIFIPESEDELVYVMGEVEKPAAHRLKSQITLMDAIMLSGGPTRNATLRHVYVVRQTPEGGVVRKVNIRHMVETADFTTNFLLQDNDVVYVAESDIAAFNYMIEQISPTVQLLNVGTDAAENFGAMREFRREVWNQDDGFVEDGD